jgi:hypothetical protein
VKRSLNQATRYSLFPLSAFFENASLVASEKADSNAKTTQRFVIQETPSLQKSRGKGTEETSHEDFVSDCIDLTAISDLCALLSGRTINCA